MSIPTEDRFTDRSRQVIELSREEAKRRGHRHLGTQHVLLGLLREGNGVAGYILRNVGVFIDSVPVEAIDDSTDWSIQDIAEAALRHANWLNHNYIGTEHLLLGICTLSSSQARVILTNLGLQPIDVCRDVIQLLGHDGDHWLFDQSNVT